MNVVSDEVLKIVDTVTPWDMAEEQVPLEQTFGLATRDFLPASRTGSFQAMVHLLVSNSVLLSLLRPKRCQFLRSGAHFGDYAGADVFAYSACL